MRAKTGLILAIFASLVFISTNLIFSQQPEISEPETQWIWGEVINVDTQNKMILIKYLDYETDQEKKININTDDKTTYENVKSVEEINPKDMVSIDYIISSDGKNIAKNISVEKPETQETPEVETRPEEITPPEAVY